MHPALNTNALHIGIVLGIVLSGIQLFLQGPMRFIVLVGIGLAVGFLLSGRMANSYLNSLFSILVSYAFVNLIFAIWTFSGPLHFLINIIVSSILFFVVTKFFNSDVLRDNTKVLVAGALLAIILPLLSVLALYFTRQALSQL